MVEYSGKVLNYLKSAGTEIIRGGADNIRVIKGEVTGMWFSPIDGREGTKLISTTGPVILRGGSEEIKLIKGIPGLFSVPQIEFYKDLKTKSAHAIYSIHSNTKENNILAFSVWNIEEDKHNHNEISRNIVLSIKGTEEVETVHILPTEPAKYNLGSLENRWRLLIGSELFTNKLQTKTINLYSGF